MINKALNILLEKRYEVLSSFLVVLTLGFVINKKWAGDFFEHVAVIKELATHPIIPQNPIILSVAPHAFFSPYSLFLGLISEFFNLSPFTVMSIFAVVNLIFLLISLKFFIKTQFKTNENKITFYSFIFFLFFWGREPWWYSGFLHSDVIFYVLPYPSTFCIALAFTILALYSIYRERPALFLLISIFLLLTVSFITHPVITLGTQMIIILLSLFNQKKLRHFFIGLTICLGSILAAFLWPYFPVFKIIFESSSATENFHFDNKELYSNLLRITWPAIFLFPVLFINRGESNLPLLFALLIFILIYFFGFVFQLWGLGRLISFASIVYHILLAQKVALFENKIASTWNRKCVNILFFLSILILVKKFHYPVLSAVPKKEPDHSGFQFLSKYISQYDVVISDLGTSFFIPAFGGKIVASAHPLYFVHDHELRRRDLQKFFKNSTQNEKERIILKYNGKFILLNRKNYSDLSLKVELRGLGTIVHEDDNFTLFRIENRTINSLKL